MKLSLSLSTMGTLLLAAAGTQAVELRPVYLEAGVGPVFQQDLNINSEVSASAGRISFDPGVRASLALGVHLTPALKAGLETGILWTSVNEIGGDSASSESSLCQVPVMAGVTYSFWEKSKCRWSPYLGLGVGGVVSFVNLGTPLGTVSDSDFTFGYQAGAGVRYAAGEHVELSLAYQFLGTLDHSWSDNGVSFKTDESLSHAVLLGLTWQF